LEEVQKKRSQRFKKNFYNNFFISCIDLRSEISYGVFLMKKLLGILVLVFLFSGKANAGVNEAIEVDGKK